MELYRVFSSSGFFLSGALTAPLAGWLTANLAFVVLLLFTFINFLLVIVTTVISMVEVALSRRHRTVSMQSYQMLIFLLYQFNFNCYHFDHIVIERASGLKLTQTNSQHVLRVPDENDAVKLF